VLFTLVVFFFVVGYYGVMAVLFGLSNKTHQKRCSRETLRKSGIFKLQSKTVTFRNKMGLLNPLLNS
jgi:hypothetical protein